MMDYEIANHGIWWFNP